MVTQVQNIARDKSAVIDSHSDPQSITAASVSFAESLQPFENPPPDYITLPIEYITFLN